MRANLATKEEVILGVEVDIPIPVKELEMH
jgi:hypothetical protein